MRPPRERRAWRSAATLARFAVSAATVLLAIVTLTTRRGHADTPPSKPIASGSTAVSAATTAPTPPLPADAGANPPDAAPHLLVTPPNYTLVDAGWDRPIRVLPATTPGPRALVYLHGYCGDVNAPGAFVPAATAHGTLIALLGDQPCKDKPGRFKWSGDIHGLDERIKRAVRLVNHALKLELDAKDITLFGYSQGAVRAESLARYYSSHYPRVILGGPPRRPKPQHFSGVRVIAVFGGEKEDTHDMLGGAEDMIAAGQHARFFLLPGVDHGDFGGETEGNRALGEILEFVDPSAEPKADDAH
jgi:predicted esterase